MSEAACEELAVQIRALRLGLDAAHRLVDTLHDRIDAQAKRIAYLERVERAAVDLAVRLAVMGTVIAHDDVARILRDVVEKEA